MLTIHNVLQGLHGMPGPKVRLHHHASSIQYMWWRLCCLVLSVPVFLMQGEPGFGMKGEKGDYGAPGPKVSDLLSS